MSELYHTVPRVFCIEPTGSSEFTYKQLWAAAMHIQQLPTVVCTTSVWELAVVLLAAILRGRDLLVCNQSANRSETVGNSEQSPVFPIPSSLESASSQSPANVFAQSKSRVGIQTSGSTGEPKIVWHQLDSLTRAVRCSPSHRLDVWGMAYHPCHFAGLQVLLQALLNESRLVCLFQLPPEQIHLLIERYGVTHISGTPTFFNLLCSSEPHVHPGTQRITSGGERLSAPIIARMREMFPNAKLNNVYASTEAGTVLAGDGEYFRIPKAKSHLIKIIDGELAIHRSLLADSLRGRWQDEFWLTGDMVEWLPAGDGKNSLTSGQDPCPETTPDQQFRIRGRQTEMINVGGYNVNPLEVEALLLDLPEVREARVLGRANSVTGQIVVCDVVFVAEQSLTVKDLRERLGGHLAAYKIPRIINSVSELPQTRSGKRSRR